MKLLPFKKPILLTIFFVLGICIFGTGCSSTQTEEGKASVEQQQEDASGQESSIVFASADYTTINPVLNTHDELPDIIFSGLMKYNGAGEPINDIAESYSFNEDTLTYTFQMKKNVKWHDGKDCTAEDVKFTLDTLTMSTDLSASITDNYKEIETVTVLDPYTVEIKLSQKNAAMLNYLTVGLLPKHLLEGKDIMMDPFNQNPIGTGRYQFVNWDVGQSIVVKKNEEYYGKAPEIDQIVFKIVPDENAKALQMKSGEIDLAWLNAQNTETFRGDENFKVYDFTTADYRAIAPNFNSGFWADNKELVGILGEALDKEAIVNSVLTGQGSVAYSPIQLNAAYHNPNVNQHLYNPEAFHEKIAALGWSRGQDGIYEKDGQRLSFTIDVRDYEEERISIATIAAQQFKEAGVEMKVNIVPKLDWNTLETFLIGQAAPFDPDNGTYTLFYTGASENTTGYSNAEVDAYLNQARQTFNPEERKEYYNKFQEAFAEEPAYIMIAYLDGNYVSIPEIEGISTERVLGHHAVGVLWNVEDWILTEK